jgi:hypothetical protein
VPASKWNCSCSISSHTKRRVRTDLIRTAASKPRILRRGQGLGTWDGMPALDLDGRTMLQSSTNPLTTRCHHGDGRRKVGNESNPFQRDRSGPIQRCVATPLIIQCDQTKQCAKASCWKGGPAPSAVPWTSLSIGMACLTDTSKGYTNDLSTEHTK